MKIIAVEGIDKSGKYSASAMLVDRLTKSGYKIVHVERHKHTTPLIMNWLQGKAIVSPEMIELLLNADKQAQQDLYEQLEKEGWDYLIFDQYILSQVAHAISNKININWLLELQANMRKPDIDIVIDISAETSMNRKGKNDIEDNYEILKVLRENYIITPEKYSAPMKFIINGEQDIKYIHEDIYQIVMDNIIELY